MKWSEINLEEKLWCIPRERVKSDPGAGSTLVLPGDEAA